MHTSEGQLTPGTLDQVDGAIQLVWYEFHAGLPRVHTLGWAETQPGVYHDVYRCFSPMGEVAEVLVEHSTDDKDFELNSAFLNSLILLNNRHAVHGGDQPFDALPLLVAGYPHIEDALLRLWRMVVHFPIEALFRRLRQYDAYRTAWLAHGEPPAEQRHPLEVDYAAARTPQAQREVHALALIHWWNRSRSLPQRAVSLVAIAAAWDQLEARGLATVSRAQVEFILAASGAGAFGL
jgi:hypothetical protein